MRGFELVMNPAETMTIRRVLKPPRVPNKGPGVYRLDAVLRPVLEENGWEFVNQSRKDRRVCYYRSPGGVIAETFNIHASIPTDDAILRLVAEFKRVASLPLGAGEGFDYHAWSGPYIAHVSIHAEIFIIILGKARTRHPRIRDGNGICHPRWISASMAYGQSISSGPMGWTSRQSGNGINISAGWSRIWTIAAGRSLSKAEVTPRPIAWSKETSVCVTVRPLRPALPISLAFLSKVTQ